MPDYRYEVPIRVRFRDLDPMGHVNNAVYASYCEQARISYFSDVLDLDPATPGMVLAHLELDYERAVTFDEDLAVSVRVPRLGTSSFPTEHEVRVGDELAATAETTQVVVDDEGAPRPIPDEWRERIADFEEFEVATGGE
ncbi:acyl-CoA thioesterase [Halegenticoccus tardaugens]|uniref:acyl-CoA thioesterase n=1 Tax=Halegenticoccus tardaugens TaxID=2071624 RepID=UPI00100B93EF|nr:thioesterase family protein [Halegenticoccus tardaugens]